MTLRLSFISALAVLATGASAQLVVIYDTITGNPLTGHTTLTPRFRMADGFNTMVAPPALWWRVHRVDVVQSVHAAATYANVTARLRFYDGFAPATPTGSVFTALASDTTWTLPTFTATAAGGFVRTFDFAAAGLKFDLVDGQTMGLTVTWNVGGVGDNRLSTALVNAAPSVGTSPHGYYRDRDVGMVGIIESADWSDTISGVGRPTNSNTMYRIHAEAVPEPATLLALGAGVAALVARRRRKQ